MKQEEAERRRFGRPSGRHHGDTRRPTECLSAARALNCASGRSKWPRKNNFHSSRPSDLGAARSSPSGPQQACDEEVEAPLPQRRSTPLIVAALLLLLPLLARVALAAPDSIIIEQPLGPQLAARDPRHAPAHIGPHLQPAFVYGARNRSINFTHVAIDEATNSLYVGATNWLFQLSLLNLKPELVLKTGPASENSRDCAPAECLPAQISSVEANSLPMHHHSFLPAGASSGATFDLGALVAAASPQSSGRSRNGSAAPFAFLAAPRSSQAARGPPAAPAQHNNYNKLLVVEPDARQLLVCGSLNQGACRKHQLGQLSNYSELIALPVVSNDEHSSSVALVSQPTLAGAAPGASKPRPILYVAATNSRLGPYRDQVPAISARYLEPPARAMQIIEKSFADSAHVDISFELRDYYLVNYLHAFQHNEFVYFATVQRKSPLRQLEEWGYITRLARLCASDLSFQSYTEITLECSQPASYNGAGQQHKPATNYNLLQDAQVTAASSHLAHHLGVRPNSAVLVSVFAQSRDHTTRSQAKSAVCLFAMDRVEAKFNENIHLCYNGSAKARNMNYIAGSFNDCPKPGRAGNIANFCNEPLKLNGSLPLVAEPIVSYDDELLTAVAALQAPSSPVSAARQQAPATSARSHQVLVLGTGDGALKRLVVLAEQEKPARRLRALEFDSVQVGAEQEPILADLSVWPAQVGELGAHQFAVAATAHKLAKLRVNACKAPRRLPNATAGNAADECLACAQLADPFCGWCATAGACLTRDECLQEPSQLVHWAPFDQITCHDYQPLAPQFVALQATSQQPVEVNVRLAQRGQLRAAQALAHQLAQAQFTCHFDYLSHAHRSGPAPRLAGATTKATQARLNLHTATAVLACPLPPPAQRPQQHGDPAEQLQVTLTVRPAAQWLAEQADLSLVEALGLLKPARRAQRPQKAAGRGESAEASGERQLEEEKLERQLVLYDCSVHASCRACLSSGAPLQSGASAGGRRSAAAQQRRWSCAWCPLSNRCTFNASHADFGCAASAIISTTPNSAAVFSSGGPQWAAGGQSNSVRAAHLTRSLDSAQASVFGASIERLSQCPAPAPGQEAPESAEPAQAPSDSATPKPASAPPAETPKPAGEILVPSGSRRAIQVALRQPLAVKRAAKLECLFELEGAKARSSAKLLEGANLVVCQEGALSYQEESATQRGQLLVILNDNQVIDSFEVILYKCHLFGVNPPALTSATGLGPAASGPTAPTHSSAAWRANQLFRELPARAARSGDCSLCLNVERKYQCAWCQNQCLHADQCNELQASTCPPPRIDSIQPSSGPLEGGTLLTIEGSNLGSNEREIQDKITVGGESCQLVMYSVSTRIVCKTAPSLHGPQAATVFVGNRAGVTSAYEKFHYKAVHLLEVNPRIGPVSGGTRLQLTGSNLNIGSRVQIFLDDIPCALDSNEISNNQITCITGPNLVASSMRITRLALMIDNSTHYLPYPFTYQPDPIITNIEPAESFLSGGRLIVVTGQHLFSPQSVKLIVYLEHKHNIINGTSAAGKNDTMITFLSPAISRDMLANLLPAASAQQQFNASSSGYEDERRFSSGAGLLSPEGAGLRLKMSLIMDDVRSVRNLDEYYHHLPHYLTYYEDPQLFRLPTPIVSYAEELLIPGENLNMKQLEQDLLVTIGSHSCLLKQVSANQVICEPPAKVLPVYDEAGRPVERPLLPIVAFIGAHLRFQIGHMQYSSQQYQAMSQSTAPTMMLESLGANSMHQYPSQGGGSDQTGGLMSSLSVVVLVVLSVVGFIVGFGVTFMFALARFRHSKAEREYKRIQLQMGSLDINGQPLSGSLFDALHFNGASSNNSSSTSSCSARHQAAQQQQQQQQQQSVHARALNYVGDALSGKKLFYQLNHHQNQLPTSFPPSPLTDISSLTGSNPNSNVQQQQLNSNQHQHLVKLSPNGTIINSSQPTMHHQLQLQQQQQQQQQHIYHSANSNSSSQSSPGSTRNSHGHLLGQNNNSFMQASHQQNPLQINNDKSNLVNGGSQAGNGNSRNFNWTQEAPSTIVPYAVIEACNLTLEGKNAIKEYV